MVAPLAKVDEQVYQHTDCLLSLTKQPYRCGPPVFCHDCLQVGVPYEQNTVYQQVMKKIQRANPANMLGEIPFGLLQRMLNGNQYTVTHQVNNLHVKI